MCNKCGLKPKKTRGLCKRCYQIWWRSKLKVNIRPENLTPCKSCNKRPIQIIESGICKACYTKQYYLKLGIARWIDVKSITKKDKESIRLILLRFKWGYETDIDSLLLTHYYYLYKTPFARDYLQLNHQTFILKIRKFFSKIFIQ